MHRVERLFAEMKQQFTSYPAGVVAMSGRIPGLAFFPGGHGLFHANSSRSLPLLEEGGVMIVGHNFDSERGFKKSLDAGAESLKSPTWRELRRLLDATRVPLESCFFTNFFMGLIQGDKATGPFPGARSPAFVNACHAFFRTQLEVIRPRVILVLGLRVPPFLADVSPDFEPWRRASSFARIDSAEAALLSDVRVDGIDPFDAVLLTHPSFRARNVGHRRYRGAVGHSAEVLLIQSALEP